MEPIELSTPHLPVVHKGLALLDRLGLVRHRSHPSGVGAIEALNARHTSLNPGQAERDAEGLRSLLTGREALPNPRLYPHSAQRVCAC